MSNAASLGITACHTCGQLSQIPQGHQAMSCPRCGARLHARLTRSISRSWALLVTATILYIPANLLPFMQITTLGRTQSDTILSGAAYLFAHGLWPLALIVFIASVMVPILKILILGFLLVSVQRQSSWRPSERTRLYRLTESVGRWSMVDIYVVAVLVALVNLGSLVTITAGLGTVFFAAVIILTMFSAMALDPRLFWDHHPTSERQPASKAVIPQDMR